VGHLGGSEILARALAAGAFGKLSDEVFVAAADDVGLDVGQAEALLADLLDEVREAVVFEVALAVGGGVEVDAVDDPFEGRVGLGDVVEIAGERLADLGREPADGRPDGVVEILRPQREVEADELVIVVDELERFGARAAW
jgi:hypothetical protein